MRFLRWFLFNDRSFVRKKGGRTRKNKIELTYIEHLTIGSYVSVRSSRYEARGHFGEHERCVRVARGVAES